MEEQVMCETRGNFTIMYKIIRDDFTFFIVKIYIEKGFRHL